MKNRRSPLVLLLVLLALVAVPLGIFLWPGGAGPEPALAREAPAVEQAAEEPEPLAPPRTIEVAEAEPEPERVAVAADPESAPDPGGALPPVELTVAGTLVVVDEDGGEQHDVSGTFQLVLWVGGSGGHLHADVVDGRWRATLVQADDGRFFPPDQPGITHSAEVQGASIGVSSSQLHIGDGSFVLVDPKARFAFGDEDVAVRFRRVSGLTLHVEDAQTGVGLAGITIVRIDDWRRDDHRHPGDVTDMARLVKDGVSPIELVPAQSDASRGVRNCLVHSPGYAWTAVELDFASGGERRVRLERGGDLDVVVDGIDGQRGVVLRLRSGDKSRSQPFCEVSLDDDSAQPVSLTGLPPGEVLVSAEVGDWWDSPLRLAQEMVTVVPGALAQTRLALEASPELVVAPLAGVLVLPAEWKLERPYLSLELLDTPLDGTDGRRAIHADELELVSGTEDLYHFELDSLQTGRYELTFHELEYAIVFELGPEGRDDVELVVPPPVELTVFVRDETTGERADVDRVLWNCKRPKGVSGGGLESVNRVPGEEHFRLRVPRGEIEIACWDDAYSRASKSVFAEEGLEVALDVRPVAAVLLRLRDGDTPVPWPEFRAKVEALDGDGQRRTTGRRDGGLWFTVSAPGRYRVEIPELDGFEPHAPVEVDLVEGETTEVTVELVRRP